LTRFLDPLKELKEKERNIGPGPGPLEIVTELTMKENLGYLKTEMGARFFVIIHSGDMSQPSSRQAFYL
jgi:hypothetical protein